MNTVIEFTVKDLASRNIVLRTVHSVAQIERSNVPLDGQMKLQNMVILFTHGTLVQVDVKCC
jgi:hypothetical protein